MNRKLSIIKRKQRDVVFIENEDKTITAFFPSGEIIGNIEVEDFLSCTFNGIIIFDSFFLRDKWFYIVKLPDFPNLEVLTDEQITYYPDVDFTPMYN